MPIRRLTVLLVSVILALATLVGGSESVTATTPLATRDISAGANHACELRADGSVWCWRANSSGQLGHRDQCRRCRRDPRR